MTFVKLTSAVAGRAAIYLNVAHIISFSDQVGGCSIKMTNSGGTTSNMIAVTEVAETVLKRILDAQQ